jgi:menaquinone-specific isochorismate synthase
MRFVRERIEPVNRGQLRTLGSRDGWLVETPEVIRSGFGGAALTVHLEAGLENHTDARAQLQEHQLEGDDGPAGTGVVAFASLPFDRNAPAQLDVPRYVLSQTRDGQAWVTSVAGSAPWNEQLEDEAVPSQEAQAVRTLTYQPTPEEYAHSVALAVEVLRRKEIDKVVLARAVTGSVPEPLDAAAIASRLRQREPICTIYSLPTPGARRFVGASPELLVRRTGNAVQCHPLAGTIALPSNVAPDDYHNWLLGSTKNLHEHSVLVEDLVRHLSSVYDDITVDPTPSIVTLRTVAHLGTWVSAVRHDAATAPDALDVLRLLHPTAAVGGIPRDDAYDLIVRLEQNDRGHYAGPVGWIDAEGDGEWWIGIRGVIIHGTEFEAWAGAGIVSESDPIAEREETKDKLASVLSSVLIDRV